MDQDLQTNSVEQRRKVLKGALAASSVLTMGYSGAALASITCVEKGFASQLFPKDTAQFVDGGETAPATTENWTWKKVAVRSFQVGSADPFAGFVVDSKVFAVSAPATEVSGAVLAGDQSGYPRPGWVLVYFDKDGNTQGSYPSPVPVADQLHMPATGSCLTSLSPLVQAQARTMTLGG